MRVTVLGMGAKVRETWKTRLWQVLCLGHPKHKLPTSDEQRARPASSTVAAMSIELLRCRPPPLLCYFDPVGKRQIQPKGCWIQPEMCWIWSSRWLALRFGLLSPRLAWPAVLPPLSSGSPALLLRPWWCSNLSTSYKSCLMRWSSRGGKEPDNRYPSSQTGSHRVALAAARDERKRDEDVAPLGFVTPPERCWGSQSSLRGMFLPPSILWNLFAKHSFATPLISALNRRVMNKKNKNIVRLHVAIMTDIYL